VADGWDRLEAMAHSIDLTGGVEARVADPGWMLARQWQVGEFRGDDAAQPAGARIRGRSAPLTSFRAPGEKTRPLPFPTDRPLEELAEITPEPDVGLAQAYASARAGRRLIRLLRDNTLAKAADALRSAFPLRPPSDGVEIGATGRAATALLAARAVDGTAIARAKTDKLSQALAALGDDDAAQALEIIADWRKWYTSRGGFAEELTWDDERLEYTFTLGVRGPAGEVVLRAPEHTGEHLDWYSFDLDTHPADSHGLKAAKLPTLTVTAAPTPVRYTGMPASRWWEFEDGAVNFGEIEAGPADLARLIVAEFATAFSVDWFVIPVTVTVGSLTELDHLEVVDTFGGSTAVPSTAAADFDSVGAARAWRLFELTDDEITAGHRAPWLFVPPSLAGDLEGPALEQVVFARDEAANLAWGIERLVESSLGRPLDRAEAWFASAAPAGGAAAAAGTADDGVWQYRLEATAPPWWIPLVAERVDPAKSAEVRLRRARMEAWALLGEGQVGPKSDLLDFRRPRWFLEEEVPTSGAVVERSWQLGRWHDGSLHVWLQRRKRPGRGERGSGVRWDLLEG
jgi:hypothetical protein